MTNWMCGELEMVVWNWLGWFFTVSNKFPHFLFMYNFLTSPEVQNRGISDPIKRHVSTKIFLKKKELANAFQNIRKGKENAI